MDEKIHWLLWYLSILQDYLGESALFYGRKHYGSHHIQAVGDY